MSGLELCGESNAFVVVKGCELRSADHLELIFFVKVG